MTSDLTRDSDSSDRRLMRVREGAMLGGVCAGVARRLGLDATLVRVLWALSVLALGGGLFFYLVFWVVIPLEGDS